MKKSLFIIWGFLLSFTNSFAQTNTFPSSGNAGIGTTTPLGKLHLVGSTTQWPLIVDNTNTTYAAAQWLSNGTAFGYIGSGYGLVGRGATDFAIRAENNLFFSTAGTANMTILNGGNIGIGTISPQAALQISTGTSNNLLIDPNVSIFSNNAKWNGTSYQNVNASYGSSFLQLGMDGSFGLRKIPAGNGNQTASYIMYGDINGNIGVGTASPTSKLSISGGDLQVENGQGRFKGWYSAGSGLSAEIGTSSGSGYLITYDRTNNVYAATNIQAGTSMISVTPDNIQIAGNVGIGTVSPSEKLSVNGNIRVKKLIVTQTNWSDYVFDSSYHLRSLPQIEQFIRENKHLPDIPSAKEVEERGISVGDNQALLLKKIEELTLYIIDQQKQINELKKQISKK